MTYKYSWWRSLPYVLGGVFFLAIAWLSGRSAHSDIDRAGTLGLASFGVWMLGEIRKVSEVVRLDDIGITRRYLGSEDAMLWGEVASVRFQAYRTVLSARNGKRISIGRYHPAYQATTQSAIDRLRPIWEAGLGRDYRLSLPWALSFSIFLGFVVVLGIRFLLANGDNLGLGLFITSGGLLLLGCLRGFPDAYSYWTEGFA